MSFSNQFEDVLIYLQSEKDNAINYLDKIEQMIDNTDESTLIRNLENFNIDELIDVDIVENFILASDSSLHYFMNNSALFRIDSDENTEKIEIIGAGGNLYGQSIVEYRMNFLVIGGALPSGQATDLVTAFDYNGNNKVSKQILKIKRKCSASVESHNKLFVVGGMKSNCSKLDSIEIIDLENFVNIGEIKMNIGRSYPSVCVFNEFIYVSSAETSYIEKFHYGSNVKTEKVQFGGDEKVKFIAAVGQYLVLFREKNYLVLDSNEKTVKKVIQNFDLKWSQSMCGVNNKQVLIKDYFSGKINKINLELPYLY